MASLGETLTKLRLIHFGFLYCPFLFAFHYHESFTSRVAVVPALHIDFLGR